MKPLQQLLSQTIVYGLSSMLGRFLNYLLVPVYTRYFTTSDYGTISEFYSYSGFVAVLLTMGMETAFFRFSSKESNPDQVLSAALRAVFGVCLLFFWLIILGATPITNYLEYPGKEIYLILFAGILVADAISAIAFARLRQQNQAWKFAGIRLLDIGLSIGLNVFFFLVLPKAHQSGLLMSFPQPGLEGVFVANLFGSAVRTLCLWPQLKAITLPYSRTTMKEMIKYGAPMIIIGMAGMVNEMFDRAMLKYLLPYSPKENLSQLGIYSACYKLAMLMSLFTQAFRYAAEPFFFQQAGKKGDREINGWVFRYFTLLGVFIFAGITLWMDQVSLFIGPDFREGLFIVPILLMANLFLGMQVNLSVWYKLTDRTHYGAWISAAGALVTIVLNVWLVPLIGYAGSAWATLICYFLMAVTSYLLGRKYYPVNYHLKSCGAYMLIGGLVYALRQYLMVQLGFSSPAMAALLLLGFVLAIVWLEYIDRGSLFHRWGKSGISAEQ